MCPGKRTELRKSLEHQKQLRRLAGAQLEEKEARGNFHSPQFPNRRVQVAGD